MYYALPSREERMKHGPKLMKLSCGLALLVSFNEHRKGPQTPQKNITRTLEIMHFSFWSITIGPIHCHSIKNYSLNNEFADSHSSRHCYPQRAQQSVVWNVYNIYFCVCRKNIQVNSQLKSNASKHHPLHLLTGQPGPGMQIQKKKFTLLNTTSTATKALFRFWKLNLLQPPIKKKKKLFFSLKETFSLNHWRNSNGSQRKTDLQSQTTTFTRSRPNSAAMKSLQLQSHSAAWGIKGKQRKNVSTNSTFWSTDDIKPFSTNLISVMVSEHQGDLLVGSTI